MQLLWQILVNGVLLGGLYALMALGLVLVWGVLNIVNLAHGALIMLGAYVCYYFFTGLGWDPFAALPVATIEVCCSYVVPFGLSLKKPRFCRSRSAWRS